MKHEIGVVLMSDKAKLPIYSTEKAAGCDFHSIENVIIYPNTVTGLRPIPVEGSEEPKYIECQPNHPEVTSWVVKRHPVIIHTGVKLQLPSDWELEVRGRSGLTFNYLSEKDGVEIEYDIIPFNGTIDADFTGEIKIKLWNLGHEPFKVTEGMRIAQGVIKPVITRKDVEFVIKETLDPTTRGEGAFGHTGLN